MLEPINVYDVWSAQWSGKPSGSDSKLNAHHHKFYHLGLGRSISKSNLAYVSEKRNYKIFEDYAYHLVAEARKCSLIDNAFLKAFDGPVYAFDSTIVDLCLRVFWWATFRRAKGGIKLHTQLDIKTNIPCFIHLTPADVHDVNALDQIGYTPTNATRKTTSDVIRLPNFMAIILHHFIPKN